MQLSSNALSSRLTAQLDSVSPFGDQLEKAKLMCYPGTRADLLGGEPIELPFFLNPSAIRITKNVQFQVEVGTQVTAGVRSGHTEPIELDLNELWFDTYDTRESVRERYIDALETLVDLSADTGVQPAVVFVFGEFTQRTRHKNIYVFYVERLTVDYTMFLPDGTPVRAKVALSLKQVLPGDVQLRQNPKGTPDQAKSYTVKTGDTLQAIATQAYGDPREWRRVASTNNIDDPMTLRAGQKLLLPPMLG